MIKKKKKIENLCITKITIYLEAPDGQKPIIPQLNTEN